MVIAHYFYPCLHRKLGEKGEVKRCGKIKFGKGMTAVVDKSIVRKIVIIIKEIDLIRKQYISYRDKEKVHDIKGLAKAKAHVCCRRQRH